VATALVAVTTSITTICSASESDPIHVKNEGPATVFLDIQNGSNPSSVTADQSSTGGYPLAPGETWDQVPYNTSGVYTIYAITAEGTAYVSAIGS
jgi:hypothetical protein